MPGRDRPPERWTQHELAVADTPLRAAELAADLVVGRLRAAIDKRGTATFAISGGSTAAALFDALARRSTAVPWARVHVAQVDERLAPDGHPDRNATTLERHLVEPLHLARENIHLVAAGPDDDEVDDLTAWRVAADYRLTLEQVIANLGGVLDVVHLGLGDDGHTASLAPGDPVLDVTDAPVAATGPYRGRRRVTLTFPAIDTARNLVWLATGAGKSPVVPRLLRGDVTIPAGRVRPGPGSTSTIVIDRAAADEIQGAQA